MSKIYDDLKIQNEKFRSQIKPCYFCSNKEVKICLDRSIFGVKRYTYYCACQTVNCDCGEAATTPRKAVELWNYHQERLKETK